MSHYIKTTALIMALALGGTGFLSGQALANDAKAAADAKVSLVEAITTAEQQAKGKAVEAEFDQSKEHGSVYKVEVLSGEKVFDVKIDAQKGTVISLKEDSED